MLPAGVRTPAGMAVNDTMNDLHAAAPTGAALSARQLQLRLGGRLILPSLSLAIPAGRVTALCGPNGCGKSTLLRALGGLLTPDAGSVWLGDTPLASLTPRQRALRLAMLSQSPAVPGGMTVAELVACGRFAHTGLAARASPQDDEAIDRALQLAGLAAYANRTVADLSGGERQRAWIAMALAQGGDVLLLDEPTTYLDVRHQLEVLHLVRALNRRHGLTVVWVLHDLNQASHFSDHMVLMAEGKVVAAGAPAEVATPALLQQVFGVPMWQGMVDGQAVCLPRLQPLQEACPC